ncbi:ABC transporter ATP-binding protein [Nocardioides bruguierae]|uniref:ABC transporter ATP-binding protein n=1 Tax=Nocardioides bruguierae TaxID=2945102 RepID=A0A9X2DCG5_9ACTN|nr:ABC transporter ATP-binding protein [Nocardioides bruguierae]MCM0621944.1 ABC transporter ATP-binding protein [Nocardioides bruguierae]
MVVVLDLEDVSFSFDEKVHVVSGVSFRVDGGERRAIVGHSGSGKSTLLALAAGILAPSSGEVMWFGRSLRAMDDDQRAALRLAEMGLVFQGAELLPELTLRQNVELPLRLLARPWRGVALPLLERLGLDEVAERLPSQVSGGQRQRAAVARAVVHGPRMVLADEPTGALDSEAGATVMRLLRELTSEQGTTLMVVTHDMAIAGECDVITRLADGRVA